MPRLVTDWHDVPAGTELIIIRRFRYLGVDDVIEVRRADGELMPSPYGRREATALVSPEFIEGV